MGGGVGSLPGCRYPPNKNLKSPDFADKKNIFTLQPKSATETD